MAQTLTLTVTGRQAAQFGKGARKVFEGIGGSIGRSEGCDWVLNVAGVSRIHALVRHLNGIYFIEDRSTNGVLLNGQPILKGEPSTLKDGDRLLIDTIDIEVALREANEAVDNPPPLRTISPAAPPSNSGPFDFDDLLRPPSTHANAPPSQLIGDDLIPEGVLGAGAGDLDPLSFLKSAGSPAEASEPPAYPRSSQNHTPATADYFHPPRPAQQSLAAMLPDNWDALTEDPSLPAPKSAVAPPSPPASAPPPPPLPASATPPASEALPGPGSLEAMLRVVVEGLMDVLRARAEIKNTFRLPVTIIQRAENNPLKFAPSAEEALQRILGPQNPGFLSGASAFQDAFDDIRCHQMATLAGVRAAFESLIAFFQPDRFEHEADGNAKRSVFAGKGKYWEKYREVFEAMGRDPDERFRRLFGDEFARAYEEQLARLKAGRVAPGTER